ncbi:MAG: hypothetical protein QXW70_00380 [Candidatus Anstonellales archaeon]
MKKTKSAQPPNRPKDHTREQVNDFLFFAGAFTVFFLLVFIYFSFVSPPKITSNFESVPLSEVTSLQLTGGESYSYLQRSAGKTIVFNYTVKGSFGCLLVDLHIQNLSFNVGCFDKKGRNLAQNQTFLDYVMFDRWMLSVKPGWSWSRNLTSRIEPLGLRSLTHYTYNYVNEEKKFGRNAYKVKVSVNPGDNDYLLWIDSQKRVLLAMEGKNLSVEILSSDFIKRIPE